ncbi:hypothetical protein [Oceanobacillus sp. CFH 90083]|uniref:hypothetical protein n=1 Tax=Oceanobacillus sp. CFH 90083 TaxID=2592336 RepID=UPI00128B1886|nr:hypothetical protein [Oceanobacillus sp. CFH 90083]
MIQIDVSDYSKETIETLTQQIYYVSSQIQSVKYDSNTSTVNIILKSKYDKDIVENQINNLVKSLSHNKNYLKLKTHVNDITVNYEKTYPSRHKEDYNEVLVILDSFFHEIAEKYGAKIREFPITLDFNNLIKNKYHFHFPQHIYSLSTFKRDKKVIETFKKSGLDFPDNEDLEQEKSILRPCLCYHAYQELENFVGSHAIYTSSGKCFRNEVPTFLNHFRHNEFFMREIIFVGSSEFTQQLRNEMIEEIWGIFCEIGMPGCIKNAEDPFFLNDDILKQHYQLLTNAKFELLYVSSTGVEVAITSFNYLEDYLCRQYNIYNNGKEEFLHSGCIAFGLDRWVTALFELFGEKKNIVDIINKQRRKLHGHI